MVLRNGQKMSDFGKLSILVQSDQHFDFVEQLTVAAFEKGTQVKIHLFGNGVRCAGSPALTGLAKVAHITVCSDSYRKLSKGEAAPLPRSVTLVPPQQISEIVQWCDRSVVF
mgnify:CR=1 FL=1